jgi:hypothetical protein
MPSEGDTSLKSVDQDVQALKKQLIDLNRDPFAGRGTALSGQHAGCRVPLGGRGTFSRSTR